MIFLKKGVCILLIALIFNTSHIAAQDVPAWSCADAMIEKVQRSFNPLFEEMQKKINEQLRDYTKNKLQNGNKPLFNGKPAGADSVYTIPVVVHILHPQGDAYGTGTNISYFQVRSQLAALNAAFSKNYPVYNGQSHPGYSSDTKIRFCLARTVMPATTEWYAGPGGKEFGVKRYAVGDSIYNHQITNTSASKLLSVTHPDSKYFPFEKYLNIWLVKSIGGNNIMGYAPKPLTTGYPLDGIVMRADIFGDNTAGGNYPLSFGLEQGKVLAHEVGHYLNLYHIFQGGCTGTNATGAATDACDLNGDFICDTPPSSLQNVFCSNSVYNTCPVNYNTGTIQSDMINNYMSYADDDCMNTFTPGQAQRMWATLNLLRHTLWQPDNLAATGVFGKAGCIPPYLNAFINSNSGVYCAGRTIEFSNPVAGNTARRFQWSFSGGIPASADSNIAFVTYHTPGKYKVFLTVSDSLNTLTDSLLIIVDSCRLDSERSHMANWFFGEYCSVEFSTGAPVLTTTALDHHTMKGESAYSGQLPYIHATISLSDSSGNLLFYSNGVSVWNGRHKKITTSPMFGKSDINASSGICYIPFPGQPGKYFIAGVYPDFDESLSGVRYVLVDVNADSVSAYQEFRHLSLPNRFSQYLTVAPHCNGKDYWIIVKGFGIDRNFYSLLVTENGIDKNQEPVISSGFQQPGFGGSGYQMKVNRQATMLILSSPNPFTFACAALYLFDNRTGKLSNERIVPDVTGYNNVQTGISFSPNGAFFYLFRSTDFQYNGPPYWLFQYRVSDMNYNILPTIGHYFCGCIQSGPDNQLYAINGYNYLAKISNPDKWGEASFDGQFINFFDAGFSVRSGQCSIPAFIDAVLPRPKLPEFSYKSASCNTYEFEAPCFYDYNATWDFGDGSALLNGHVVAHTYRQSGVFEVKLFLSKNADTVGVSSKKITILPLATSISGPDTVCAYNVYTSQYFAPVLNGANYHWTVSNGIVIGPNNLAYAGIKWDDNRNNGMIMLSVKSDNCEIKASLNVTIKPSAGIDWLLKDSVCINDSSLSLVAYPAGGMYSGTGVANNNFSPAVAGPGVHKIVYTYRNNNGCLTVAEKLVKVKNCISTPLSVCEEFFNTVQITPNVVNDILEIKFPSQIKFYMGLFNATGQRIKTGSFHNNKINVSGLAAGMYYAVIYCGSNYYSRTYKFFKY